ncbi:MAG: hypothetical protein JNK14_20880 [Chitinophagaceae bacterium]|nr:hypothetical protein [Chitinophagaceae bacterium]
MNRAVDQLAISILKKPLSECSADELRQLSVQYPWFAPAQLLYAEKLKEDNPSLYESQVQKTALYFPNRLWLHHLLNENDHTGNVSVNFPSEGLNPVVQETEQPPVISHEEVSLPEVILAHTMTEAALEEKVNTVEAPPEEAANDNIAEATLPDTRTEESVIIQTDNGQSEEENSSPETELSAEPAMRMPEFRIEPINPATAPLSFQPYHTVDYFASQGIRFKEQEKPKDRFGQQLLSFTEWLKTLKKVPASDISTAVASDPGAEKKVEQLAEHSLAERHVVTEAMAEVWIKQGNYAKAEEIYRKLSLLDPPKTAYFAAKIEELKKKS